MLTEQIINARSMHKQDPNLLHSNSVLVPRPCPFLCPGLPGSTVVVELTWFYTDAHSVQNTKRTLLPHDDLP